MSNDLPKGYWQAIENLAYYILKQTQVSQHAAISILPTETFENASFDELMQWCEQFYTEEELKQWENLENIMIAITQTYGVSIESAFGHTMSMMHQLELESGEFFQ